MSSSRQRRIQYSQNFLHNSRLVRNLVSRSSLNDSDLALEIGPGDGAITSALVDACRHVIAIEKDPYQVERLDRKFRDDPRITLFEADFLEFPLPRTSYKVFASLPFNATAAIVGKLTSGVAPPDDMYLVVQREAAERFMGEPAQTLVGLQIHPWFAPSIVFEFRRTDFLPVPSVESVLLRLARRSHPLIADEWRQRYLDFVISIFTAWKATVRQAVRAKVPNDVFRSMDRAIGQALDRRPSEIEPDLWITMFSLLVEIDDAHVWKAIDGAQQALQREQSGLSKRHRTSVSARPLDRKKGR